MNEYLAGLLTVPAILLLLALAGAAVFGTWLLLEKWAASRWRKLEPIQMPEALGGELNLWTLGHLGLRGAYASVILAGAHVRSLRVGSAAVMIAWGKPDKKTARTIGNALSRSLVEVAQEEAGAARV